MFAKDTYGAANKYRHGNCGAVLRGIVCNEERVGIAENNDL